MNFSPAGTICLALVLSVPSMAAAVDCLGPATAAFGDGRLTDSITEAEKVWDEEECGDVRPDLQMLRALALYRVAELEGGQSWCIARDAYAPLRSSDDPDYARTAEESHERAAERCLGARSDGSTDPVHAPPVVELEPNAVQSVTKSSKDPVVDRQVLVWGGVGTAVAGAIVAGFGVAAALEADEMAGVLGDESLSDPDLAASQLRAEGRATGLLIGGGVTAAVGIAALVWGLSTEPDAVEDTGLGLQIEPSRLAIWGRF